MKQFVIIDIESNTVQPDGEVLIVKANPVKEAEGFEHLEQMFGKKYFNYAMNEYNENYEDEDQQFNFQEVKKDNNYKSNNNFEGIFEAICKVIDTCNNIFIEILYSLKISNMLK